MKRKQFSFFAYNPPTSGTYTINGYTYKSGEDFRSVKRCREYLNCGFDMFQMRYEYYYTGEDGWENSQTKYMWDIALAAGIKRILVSDRRLDRIIRHGDCEPARLVGEGCPYTSEAELDAKVAEYVSDYKDEAGFYGIQMVDEPRIQHVHAYGELARSLKRVLPNVYLQVNLNPMGVKYEGLDDKQSYERYVREMLEGGNLKNISFDDYPFRREYIISGNNILTYQMVARICKEYGAELNTVLQSFSHSTGGVLRTRRMLESDVYWETNVAMGFGTREYAFYTYMPKVDFDYAKGGDGIDGACFINNDGSRSALYNYTKRIIKEMQKFSKVALKYEYESSYIITEKGKTKDDFEWTVSAETYGECPFAISVDKGVALVTEQRNGEARLYMIENIGNVKDELFENAPPMKVEFSLPNGEKTFYYRGEKVDCQELNGKFIRELKVGDALFVEIKK